MESVRRATPSWAASRSTRTRPLRGARPFAAGECRVACTGGTGSAATRSPTSSCSAPAPEPAPPIRPGPRRQPPDVPQSGPRRARREEALAPFDRGAAAETRTPSTGDAAVDQRPGGIIRGAERSSRPSSELDGAEATGSARRRRGHTNSSTPARTSRSTCATCSLVSECVARRRCCAGEPRRPHPRRLPDDGPAVARRNLICSARRRRHRWCDEQPMPADARRPARPLPRDELAKYLTPDERPPARHRRGHDGSGS